MLASLALRRLLEEDAARTDTASNLNLTSADPHR